MPENQKTPWPLNGQGVGDDLRIISQLHDPPQDPVLQLPPLPRGLAEVMENPERYPASVKSTLTAPHFSRRLASTKNCRPPSSNTLSPSFDSSRAKPKEGPLQPPCIRAMRTAELILFCSRYAFRLLTAKSVTSNINASSKVKMLHPFLGKRVGVKNKIKI
jgi:hypothetical protein